MDLTDGGEAFRQRLTELRALKGTKPVETPQATPPVTHDDDLVPDISDTRSEESVEIDDVVSRIDIIDAYNRWCRKMQPDSRGKREGIMISCPNPAHPDTNPSAWINLDKQTWYCGGCAEGGDLYDIAAWHFGFPVPGYKDRGSFPDLRRKMATDLGYTVRRTPGGTEIAEAPSEPEPSPTPDPEPAATVSVLPTPLTLVEPEDDDPDSQFIDYPTIDWKAIFPEETFLNRWMQTTAVDDSPEEYYFWLGLQAISFACGRDAYLVDNPNVITNLFVCLFGGTGQGKSRAVNYLVKLLREALQYDADDPLNSGTYIVPSPGSAEGLVDSFSKPVYDPTDPKKLLMYGPVRGLVRFDELATLAGRAGRLGSVMKPTLMEFYDAYQPVELRSRGHGHVRAESHFCQCITTTQPRAIKKLVSDEDVDSGFLNRWVFASGPDKELTAYNRSTVHVDDCVEPLRNLRSYTARRVALTLEGSALQMWEKFFHSEIAPIRRSIEGSLETRADLTMKKLMVLMAVNYKSEITPEVMEKVIALWPYLHRSYQLLSGQIGLGALEDCHSRVLEFVKRYSRKKNTPPTMRQIYDSVRYHKYDMELTKKTVALMCSMGELEEQTIKPARGPVSIRYKYRTVEEEV